MVTYTTSDDKDINEKISKAIINRVEESTDKPWTVVSDVAEQLNKDNEEVRQVLRHLTLNGTLTPTADGDIRKTIK